MLERSVRGRQELAKRDLGSLTKFYVHNKIHAQNTSIPRIHASHEAKGRNNTNTILMNSNDQELLEEFTAQCSGHPEQRFWQALRNWSDIPYLVAIKEPPYQVFANMRVGKPIKTLPMLFMAKQELIIQ